MPKVAPWYSNEERPEKYNDNTRCGPGSQIPNHKRIQGTGGKPHCQECAKLNSEGK